MENKIKKGENVFIHKMAYVAGNVTLGDNSNIWCGACIRGDQSPIVIGKNTNVQDNATIHVSLNSTCELGDFVTVGHNAVVHSAKVGNCTIIGMGAIILDGAEIGENCVIGAGSLIPPNKKIPAGSVVVGNPYKIIRQVSEGDIEHNIANANAYVALASEYKGV